MAAPPVDVRLTKARIRGEATEPPVHRGLTPRTRVRAVEEALAAHAAQLAGTRAAVAAIPEVDIARFNLP
jgi:hypothetical protein